MTPRLDIDAIGILVAIVFRWIRAIANFIYHWKNNILLFIIANIVLKLT
jgi:hypothetical protein